MNFLQKIKPEWPLRLGLGLMYIYSGYDLFYHPSAWIWAVPKWYARTVTSISSLEAYLRFQGVAELIIGLLFIAWFSGKWGVRAAALLAATEFLFILIFVGINPITFRDIGLLGAALALVVMSFKKEVASEVRLP